MLVPPPRSLRRPIHLNRSSTIQPSPELLRKNIDDKCGIEDVTLFLLRQKAKDTYAKALPRASRKQNQYHPRLHPLLTGLGYGGF